MSHELLTPHQMLEVAIGYENGIVNFRMLYTLLNILINNVDGMDTSRIEIDTKLNSDVDRDFSRNAFPKHSIVLSEYLVGQDGEKLNKLTKDSNGKGVVKKVIVVSNDTQSPIDTLNKSRSNTSMATNQTDGATNAENFVVEDLTTNVNIYKDRTEDNCKEHFIELEKAVKNLTILVNDLSNNLSVFETSITTLNDSGEIGQIKKKLETLEKICYEKNDGNCVSPVNIQEKVSDEHSSQKLSVSTENSSSGRVSQNMPRVSALSKLDTLLNDVTKLKDDFKALKLVAVGTNTDIVSKQPSSVDESRLKTIEEKLVTLESVYESLDLDNKKPKKSSNTSKITLEMDDVQTSINTIKVELEKLGDLSGFLLSEKDSVTQQLEQISTQIEAIKEEKADKDVVREALMDKADYNTIKNKVSIEQFNETKRDMSKHIVELIQSLTEKEQAWKQTIEDIQRLLGAKIDHHDIIPLKSYIKTQIEHLQEQLKALETIKEETEAAGTRSKFLRNVNCVSCDAASIMRKVEPCHFPKHESFRPIISLKPYLCYKLDSLRHDLQSTNYRIYGQKPMLTAFNNPNYLCNRYCGGSHTKFSIYDRVNKCAFLRPCCNNKKY